MTMMMIIVMVTMMIMISVIVMMAMMTVLKVLLIWMEVVCGGRNCYRDNYKMIIITITITATTAITMALAMKSKTTYTLLTKSVCDKKFKIQASSCTTLPCRDNQKWTWSEQRWDAHDVALTTCKSPGKRDAQKVLRPQIATTGMFLTRPHSPGSVGEGVM